MEFISTDDYFILQPLQKTEGMSNLFVCRRTGKFSMRPAWDLVSQDNPERLGMVMGLVGKLKLHRDLAERLLLVRHCQRLGALPGKGFEEEHGVYKVLNVVTVPISTDPMAVQNLALDPWPKYNPDSGMTELKESYIQLQYIIFVILLHLRCKHSSDGFHSSSSVQRR